MGIFSGFSRIFSRRLPPIRSGSTRSERGRYGEDLAAAYCRKELGYKLLARNWRWERDELDLVCLDGEVLVFIEVRARSARARVGGFHSVDAKKKKALRRGCRAYINQLQNPPKHVRFDVTEVVLSDEGVGEIHHYQNVTLFSKHYSTLL